MYVKLHAAVSSVFFLPAPFLLHLFFLEGGALKAFELMTGSHLCRVSLVHENAKYLRAQLLTGGGHWPSDYPVSQRYQLIGHEDTPVLPVVFAKDSDRVFRIGQALLDRGYVVAAAMYPAVPLHSPRFRVTSTAAYTKEIIDAFVKTLVEVTVATVPQPFVDLS
eukprot:GHVT01006378.1.p1 GENE.GHVT01006378.1~~GHVT01006378.1.p1  ORF type:complete len:164 (+),score=17.17 GHVT01006378.1:196-687(+)